MKTNKKGFTLVELVIVIAVIAILAAVLIPTFSGIIARANANAARQRAVAVRDEILGQYYNSIEEMDGMGFEVEKGGKRYIFVLDVHDKNDNGEQLEMYIITENTIIDARLEDENGDPIGDDIEATYDTLYNTIMTEDDGVVHLNGSEYNDVVIDGHIHRVYEDNNN